MPEIKLCVISPSLRLGGIERALTVLTEQFTQKGYHVDFISCLKGEHFYSLPENVIIHEPSFRWKSSFLNKISYYSRLVYYIRKKVLNLSPDRVLVFGDWFSPIALLALYGTNIPVFISDRTSPDYKFKFPIPQLKRWLYPRSKGFIAQTGRAAEYKRTQFRDKLNIRVIPNAIRIVQLHPEIDREPIILYLGRFAREKGPERLIRAFAQIEDKGTWKLYMAGDGPMLQEMKVLAEELNLIDDVVFPGLVKDVDKLFARTSIFVLPSVLEGFPNALCEAMAAGLPCVCFASIPYEEIMQEGTSGFVVPENDISRLSEVLERLINDSYTREKIGKNAISQMVNFSAEIVAERYIQFLTIPISK